MSCAVTFFVIHFQFKDSPDNLLFFTIAVLVPMEPEVSGIIIVLSYNQNVCLICCSSPIERDHAC